ncbi:prolyl 3-hydroxylase OGFOD1-like [Scylla paramamosain]|uniref:prolyl 3-hydroxylase OGFOD1-like n=1 Tax=Scylla paramamosain TaxID=85552 RepID=UPI0030834434
MNQNKISEESQTGEKKIEVMEEKVPPITTEEMKVQKKKKQKKKKKKKGGLQMEEGVNAEENKEEEKKVEDLSQAEEKKQEGNNNVTEAKKKRKRKKKKKVADNASTTSSTNTTTTTPLSPKQKRKRKKGKMEQENKSSTNKEEKEETVDDKASPAKKIKIEASEEVNDGTGKKNKRKRKKKKKKGKASQEGNEVMNDSKDEGKGTNEIKKENLSENNDEKEVAMNNINKPPMADSTKAKTNKENEPNKPQEKDRKVDMTGKETTESNKTDETGNKGEEKKGKKRRKRKGKGNQSDSNVKTEDNKEENKEKEEEVEMPAKKMRKEDIKSQEMSTDAKIELQTNSTQPVLSASQKKKLKKKQRKALEKQAAGVTGSSPQTSTPPATASKDRGVVAPLLHPSCSSEDSKKKIKAGWQEGTGPHKESVVVNKGDVEVIRSPFLSCYIQNLLESEEFLEGVKKELDDIPLLSKNNDLYKFHQTADLKDVTTPYISALRDFLYKDIRIWLQDITGLPLQDTVDMGSSRYSHTDVLLCHDDVLEGRLIAYILYLVPPWCSKDGGTLDLFSCDDSGHPKDIVRSLVPKNNAFAFFQVCPASFHQVSEVLSQDKTRLSINGWFHGPSVTQQEEKPLPSLPLLGPGQFEEEDFYAWINPMYLDMETQKEIRKKFCAESELELENFLTDEAYEKLSAALLECTAWRQTGPANRHSYEVLPSDAVPQEVRKCQQFLQCEAFFLVLSQLTGLRLHPKAPQDSDNDDSDDEKSPAEPNPRCRVDPQRWGHKCYTLLRDDCVDQHSALDAYLFANVSKKWKQEMGGHITYIAKDEDEELLTVVPRSNCLSLVYCDAQTLRFTKYINASCLELGTKDSHYHSMSCVYYE